jgi:hypothetical protein
MRGYALLTPLVLPNGTAVLVERGWIPAEDNTPESWRQFDEPGTAAVEGIIRLPQTKGEMGGIPDPTLAPGETSLDFWNFVNIDRIQQQIPYPLLNVYIQQAPSASQTSLPYRSLPEIDLAAEQTWGMRNNGFFTGLLVFGYQPLKSPCHGFKEKIYDRKYLRLSCSPALVAWQGGFFKPCAPKAVGQDRRRLRPVLAWICCLAVMGGIGIVKYYFPGVGPY